MRRRARMLSQNSTAQTPSFSRIWFEPVPKLSSPQRVAGPASSRLPKNFHPLGLVGLDGDEPRPGRRGAGRHRTRNAREPPGVARRERGVGGEDRQRIRGGHVDPPPEDQVAVAVAVGGRAEIGSLRGHQES